MMTLSDNQRILCARVCKPQTEKELALLQDDQQYNRDAKAKHLKELRKIKYGESVMHDFTKLREASDKLAELQERKRIYAEFDL